MAVKKAAKKKAPKRVVEDPKYKIRLESFAKLVHESGRKAVEAGKVLVKMPDSQLESFKTGNERAAGLFVEWADLPEDAKEGRRMQAAFFLDGRRRSAMKALFR